MTVTLPRNLFVFMGYECGGLECDVGNELCANYGNLGRVQQFCDTKTNKYSVPKPLGSNPLAGLIKQQYSFLFSDWEASCVYPWRFSLISSPEVGKLLSTMRLFHRKSWLARTSQPAPIA